MFRLRFLLPTLFLAGIVSGCGDDQPNAPAQPSETGPEFAKKTADMMKEANKGMDLKNAQQAKPPSSK